MLDHFCDHTQRRLKRAKAPPTRSRRPRRGDVLARISVHDVGGGMAELQISERLPHSLVQRIRRMIDEGVN